MTKVNLIANLFSLLVFNTMKKLLIVLLVLALIGVGGYFAISKKMTPQNLLQTAKNKIEEKAFSTIGEVLTKNISMKCVFKDEEGKETTTYIKNGKIRFEATGSSKDEVEKNQPGVFLIRDKKMYMWDDKSKAGMIYSVQEPENVTPIKEDTNVPANDKNKVGNENFSASSMLKEIEKYKDSCKMQSLDDSLFEVPKDVKFQDMEEFQKQMTDTVEKMKEGNNQEEMQKYIEEMLKKQGDN